MLGLALIAPVVDPIHDHRRLPERVILRRDPELLATLDPTDAEEYDAISVVQSRANWRRFRETTLPGIRAADAGAMERLARRYALPSMPEARLPVRFERPVLIVTGRQDHVAGHEDQHALAGQYPHATFAVLDAAGHNVQLDHPETVGALVASWASQITPTEAPRSTADDAVRHFRP